MAASLAINIDAFDRLDLAIVECHHLGQMKHSLSAIPMLMLMILRFRKQHSLSSCQIQCAEVDCSSPLQCTPNKLDNHQKSIKKCVNGQLFVNKENISMNKCSSFVLLESMHLHEKECRLIVNLVTCLYHGKLV